MKERKPTDLEAFGEHLLGKSKYSIFFYAIHQLHTYQSGII